MTTFHAMNRILLKSDLRDYTTLLFTFLVPLGLLLAMVNAFGGAPSANGGDSVNEVSANVLAFGIAYGGSFSGAMHLAIWRENGMFQVLRGFPISTGSILYSQAFVGAVMGLLQAILILSVAVSPLVGMELSGWAFAALLPLFLGYLVFFFIGVLLAIVIPSIAGVSILSNLVIIPLGFVGGAMLPLIFLPTWVQDMAAFTPIYHLRVGLYWPLIEVGTWGEFLLGCAYLFGLSVLLYVATRKAFTWR